jgi:S1-C subfamily serine protease
MTGFFKIDWKVVFEASTNGAAKTNEGIAGGGIVIIQDAFASAINNLIANQEFIDLLKWYKPDVANVRNLDTTTLEFYKTPTSNTELSKRIDDIRLAVVSIDTGGRHGSGLFITPNLIRTNQHVVGDAELVCANLLTGRKLVGDVLRRHPARDVALVQVETTGIYPLPIRDVPTNIAEEVFAIGSPKSKGLSGTVSKGIVSKHLANQRGLEDIQADVDIHGGNSGGPLLDKNGNVVSISYAGLGDSSSGYSVGLNFFIPIMDALNRLKMEAVDKNPGSQGRKHYSAAGLISGLFNVKVRSTEV